MDRMIFITGGARSGKSAFAEATAKGFGDNILYIATSVACDDEMRARILKHRERRPPTWETIEAHRDMSIHLKGRVSGKDAVLLDCATVMVTSIMLEECDDWDNIKPDGTDRVESKVLNEMAGLLSAIKESHAPFIIVANEVGLGVVPPYPMGRAFRDIGGRVNQMLAKEADEVYFCVSGIPVKIK